MTISIIAGSAFTLAGSASAFLGTMFIIASSGDTTRLTAGAILALTGAALIFAGVRLFRKGLEASPSTIRKRILRAAAKNNGEASIEAIIGEAGDNDLVRAQLNIFTRSGIASKEKKEGRTFYIFPDYQFKLLFKKCPYCGNDYPVKHGVEQCPSCGGDLKMTGGRTSSGDDKFSMDL